MIKNFGGVLEERQKILDSADIRNIRRILYLLKGNKINIISQKNNRRIQFC